MVATAQTYIKNKDFTVEQNIGLPDDLGYTRVEGIGCHFPAHNASSTHSKCDKGQQHNIYDPGQAEWSDITIYAHGNAGQTKAAWDLMKTFAEGDPVRGSVTVNIVNPKDAYSTIFSFTFQEITILHYSPGIQASVEHPDTLSFSFTFKPGRVEIEG